MVVEVMTTHELSQRRACGLIGITRRGLKRAPLEEVHRWKTATAACGNDCANWRKHDGAGVARCST
jgi:hypothetical protein